MEGLMVDKKLLQKIDTILSKADLCLAEEDVKLQDQTGNDAAEKTTAPSDQGLSGPP